ncbi:hypothetical protein XM38_026110 [Halomicronema hongdechloris C2206]|uniref:Chromosome partition protein Smc n=1 Tax=Halomicronema hongdechloris C2206 TaxID=1641165 RepID=A0A1Z3HNC9_9CYAN|nr:hypothetical protein [Halomicronema hongdechloris]ASC71657.1 hypothetical protein XM38_026110 [Halomicronema hongdechloris C2206]
MKSSQSSQIRVLIEKFKLRLEDFPPYERDGKLYFRRTDTGKEISYLKATCDELRHGLTNYETLLAEIKTLSFKHSSIRDAVIYAIKYEATRKVYHTQRIELRRYYNALIARLKKGKIIELRKISGKDKKTQEEIEHLENIRDALLAQVKQKDNEIRSLQKQVNEYIGLCEKYARDWSKEKSRRELLGRNNKSLGAYKGLYGQEKKKTAALKQEIQRLRAHIASLEQQLDD